MTKGLSQHEGNYDFSLAVDLIVEENKESTRSELHDLRLLDKEDEAKRFVFS